jgi:hypothetical protein
VTPTNPFAQANTGPNSTVKIGGSLGLVNGLGFAPGKQSGTLAGVFESNNSSKKPD